MKHLEQQSPHLRFLIALKGTSIFRNSTPNSVDILFQNCLVLLL